MKNNNTSNLTIADIAEKCGVSTMTVSRALRPDSPVKESTREKILETAREMGYVNTPGKGRPRLAPVYVRPVVNIVVGLPGCENQWFYSGLVTAIEQKLNSLGYDSVFRTFDGAYENFINLTETLKNSDSAGTILTGDITSEHLKALIACSPNPVLADNTGGPLIGSPYSFAANDNVEAARMGISHLLWTGRKRVLLLKGHPEHYFSCEIERGYIETLKINGISPEEELILEADFSIPGAQSVIAAALNRGLSFDSVFTNDQMACGVIRAVREKGLKVPDDIAVVGCDGLPVGEQLDPPLTTVVIDYTQMAARAVDILMRKKENPSSSPERIRILPELVIRQSA